MKTPAIVDEPKQRLKDLDADHDLLGVATLARAGADAPATLTPAARARVHRRLRRSMTGRVRLPLRRLRPGLVLALTLIFGGVVGAAMRPVVSDWVSRRAARNAAPAVARLDAPRAPRAARSGRVETPPPAFISVPPVPPVPEPGPAPAPAPVVESAPPAPAVAVAPATEVPLPPAPHRHTLALHGLEAAISRPSPPALSPLLVPAPPAPLPVVPAPFSLPLADTTAPSTEAGLLGQALRKLRGANDAIGALAALDERRLRFAGGDLEPEARALRIEVLLRLGRTDGALREFNDLPFDELPRQRDWRVVRGELRAQAGAWRDADADFDTALRGQAGVDAGTAADAVTERALWGHAVTRAHLGDAAAARAACSELLRRFPQGRFAAQAARVLDPASRPR